MKKEGVSLSIKIYYGMRIDPVKGRDVWATIAILREAMNTAMKRRYVNLVANVWETRLAGHTDEDTEMFLRDYRENWADTSMTIFPGPDESFLALPHGPSPNIELVHNAVLNYVEGASGFGYWNNSDRPEDVTEEGWDERRDVWAEALGPSWVPSRSGVTVGLGVGWWEIENTGWELAKKRHDNG